MKNLLITLIFGLIISSCKTEIKNSNAKIEIEEGTKIETSKPVVEKAKTAQIVEEIKEKSPSSNNHLLGYWVGYFEKDDKNYNKDIYADEGFYWNRENKIK